MKRTNPFGLLRTRKFGGYGMRCLPMASLRPGRPTGARHIPFQGPLRDRVHEYALPLQPNSRISARRGGTPPLTLGVRSGSDLKTSD